MVLGAFFWNPNREYAMDNNEYECKANPIRYFLGTPFIMVGKLFAAISTFIVGQPIMLLDFTTLKVIEADFDDDDNDLM